MCKLIANYEEKLGARRTGWVCYSPKTRDYTGLTDKQVKNQLDLGDEILGLTVNEGGEVVVDTDFTTCMLARSGIATFTPILENDMAVNKSYTVVRVIQDKAGTTYELITNKCGFDVVTEEKLKAMMMFMPVGGVKLEGDKLIIHKGIEIVIEEKEVEKKEEAKQEVKK